MYELLDLLGRLPKPVKTLGIVFLLMPVCLVAARAMGFGQYWWAVVGGLIVIALIVAVFGGLVKKGEKARGGAFERDLARDARGGAGASKQEVREAVRELSQKWTESLAQLKGTGLQIYSLPWYLLIGEPQSGKSTTLKNSGLEFPVGGDGLSGSGGTRNCDWWFANEAVILDTAGRFTFQEEAAPDATEWSTFLKMLKKYRRDCPINGVLVVIPATSLLEDTPEEQDKKAENIRAKLLNLQRVLEIRFPVFVMVTKADRILGFSEFFSKLDPVDQRQLVGWSNPVGPDKPYVLTTFDEAYEEILTRIHKLRMKFTATEEIVQNVDRIFVFPEELRALSDSLKRYFKGIFLETRYDDPFVFRGFYLSSGVQQGKPIARATRELLGSSAEGIVENLEQIFKRSRAFFIKDFYEKKVFPEQGLIARTKAAILKERKTVWVIRGLSVFIVLLVLGGMIPAYIGIKRIVEPIKRNVAAAQECVEKEPCSIPKAYGISRQIYTSQQEIRKHPFIFAMFFRGAASGELSDLLGKINQKLFFMRVANPLMKEGEKRMAQLDWAGPYDYRTFFGALDNHLKWWAVKKAVPGLDQKPLVETAELKIIPLIQFCQNTKGMPATNQSKEIDDWVASIATDGTPDMILGTFLKEPPKDPETIQVPDPAAPIRKFEEFWTVANLARWDFRLNQMLALYVQKYSELLKIEDPSSRGYLDRTAATGKEFQKIYDDTTKHLGTTKPGSQEFPGFGPDDWRRNFDADYDQLMRFTVVVPGVINENARNRIKGQMESDWKNLEAQILAYAYLVVPDTQNAAKKAWSPSAAAISPMLVGVTAFADLAAFEVTENPKAVVEEASRKSTPLDQKATLEAFSKKQVDEKAKATANLTAIAAIPPDQKMPWQDTALSAFVPRTADLALVYRVLPYTQQFLDSSIGPMCPENVCFTRNHAQQMIPLGVSYISFAEASSISTRPDVDQLAQAHAETMLDYLRRYIDRFAGRGGGGGGGGFVVPGSALRANSWREFQAAITRWVPESQGSSAPVTDMSGALAFDDVQMFAASNRRLNSALAYYKSKAAPARRSSAPVKAPPALVAAANLFKNNVEPLSEQELKAWRQLSLAQEGVSLRGYHAFSRNPAVRRSNYGRQLLAVEKRGANLIRDAIEPSFQQASEPVVRKIREQTLGQFPFIRESQLRQERVAYAAGTSLKPGGSGNSVTYRLDLPSISQGHFSGVLTDVGSLADEYALNPILWGWEPEFDFVGDSSRGLLAVGRGWQLFLFGGGRSTSVIKEHKVEIRPLPFTPSPGKRFMGDRVNSLFLFDRNTVVRPSTDFKTGKQPNPFVWRLGPSDAPMSITGRDEESKSGWTGSLEAYGGPLRFFYFVRVASEERDRRDDSDDPEREREKEKIWTIRVVIPNALQRNEPLEGLFELAFEEPMPPILPN